jgi:hypothetical protein
MAVPDIVGRIPTNQSILQPSKFQMGFARLPSCVYNCTNANLPGINLSEIPRSTPFVDIYSPGEKTQYNTFNITFIIDEDLKTWFEIHDWIRGLTFPTSFTEYANFVDSKTPVLGKIYSDCYLTIMTNNNLPNVRIKFIDCFPVNLSDILFSTSETADQTLSADASFRFSYFEIERLRTPTP